MIIDDRKIPSVSTLTGESQTFRIATNAKAFRVLVDGIYADKIGSIVRELLSNAYDAHVRRGNVDTPFEVRLPNALNPTFSVRDYGCSMNHEFVMQSYSTLFESSKADSNDEVGAFGLGAKSFLAYTDACTLTCWSGDEVRAYTISLADSGVPEVRLVHRGHSTVAQGVEVTFAVAQGDFGWFQRSALACAYGFDVLPTFVGSEVLPIEPVHTGNGWRLYDQQINGESPVIVRQGCAVYPVGRWMFGAVVPNGYSLIVDSPIGTVGVTASREALSMSADQKDALGVRINVALEELHEQVRAEYHALPEGIARARFAHENITFLGKGDWPQFVRLLYSVERFDAGALVPYDVFPVITLDKMLLIHDDGTKVQRRLLRLRSLARGNRYSVYIETDLKRVREIAKLLDLKRSQIIKIAEMPDVSVSRSSSGGSAKTKKVVSADTVWAYSLRNDAWAGPFSWRRDRGTVGGFTGDTLEWVGEIVARHGATTITFLTKREAESALASGKITEEMRIDRLIEAELAASAGLDDRLLAAHVWTLLGRRIYDTKVRALLIGKIGLTILKSTPGDALCDKVFPKRSAEIERKAVEIVRSLSHRYPLLFGSDNDAISAYVEMCDEKVLDR